MTATENTSTATMTGVDVVVSPDAIGSVLIVDSPENRFGPFLAGRIVDTLIGENGPAVDMMIRGEKVRTTLSAKMVAYRLRVA